MTLSKAFSKAGAVLPVSFLAVRHRDLPRLVDLDLGDMVPHGDGDSTFMVMGFRIDLWYLRCVVYLSYLSWCGTPITFNNLVKNDVFMANISTVNGLISNKHNSGAPHCS